MARDRGETPNIQKKLFGPFNGLNGAQSPFTRELPPSPNAKAMEFATEWTNLEIDHKTQELVSRWGIEYVEKGSADISLSEVAYSAGIFKWNDYDSLTGKVRERAINLTVDELGVPTIYVYRWVKTLVRLSSGTLDGKKFAIIEDPDNSYAKRFVIYNTNGTVYSFSSTLAGLSGTSATYIDYDSARDGAMVLSAVDLVEPTTLTFSSSAGTPTEVAEFWSLAKKSVTNANLFLTGWTASQQTEDANYFTAALANNVIYFSGGGTEPVLKYDGQMIYKAGMPHAALGGSVYVSSITANSFESANGETIDAILEGLMNPVAPASASFLGRFIWIATYEHGDGKNNFIEGEPYLPGSYSAEDDLGMPAVGVTIKPKYKSLTETSISGGVVSGNVHQYLPNSLVPATGFDARGALLFPVAATYSMSGTATVTVTSLAHGLAVGAKIYVDCTSGTGVDGYYTVATVPTVDTFTYTSGGALTTSGNIKITRVLVTANVAANFGLRLDDSHNTLIAGDFCLIRATLLTDTVASDPYYRFPVLITAKVATSTSATLTIDYDYPITVEIAPGGDMRANALSGLLSNLSDDSQRAVAASLESITTWTALASWTWLGLSTYTKIVITPDFAISNNMRINIYRNKANINEENAYDPASDDGVLVPDFFLLNILPNNPFVATTSMGPHFDNCKDSCLGAALDLRTTLEVENKGIKDFSDLQYSPLPKGRWISSYKGRLYITDDPENENLLWRSSLLYGSEYFTIDDTLSMESPVGDRTVAAVGNDEAIFVLKDNSIKIILSDFTQDNIRVDELTIGDDGCIAPLSAVQLENGVAYLTNVGPAWVQYNKELVYLGANDNGISRIRDRLVNDASLDLKRAWAAVDTDKQHYKLYIPKATKPSVGLYNPTDSRTADNPYYNDQGVLFVFDYANDSWFEQTGINARAGMVKIEENNRFFYLTAYAKNSTESDSTLEWALYRDRNYDNLWAYADRLERGGVEELRAISWTYGTDWLAFEDPNLLKQFLRLKIYGIRTFDDLTVKGTGGTTSMAASGDYAVLVRAYRDWRGDSVHSSSTVNLTDTNYFDFMKVKNNKCGVMKFLLSGGVLFNSPRIQAIEVEAVLPFKGKMKPWGTP